MLVEAHMLSASCSVPCPPRTPPEPEEAGKLAAERARAPVVPFRVDLCYWGQEQPGGRRVLK